MVPDVCCHVTVMVWCVAVGVDAVQGCGGHVLQLWGLGQGLGPQAALGPGTRHPPKGHSTGTAEVKKNYHSMAKHTLARQRAGLTVVCLFVCCVL